MKFSFFFLRALRVLRGDNLLKMIPGTPQNFMNAS